MDNDKECSPEDLPDDGEMVGIGRYHPLGICARRRDLCYAAEEGDTDAMTELLEIALRLSAEIDLNKETSLDRIALASLIQPIKYLLNNETAKLAAFGGFTRREGSPKSKEAKERHKAIAYEIGKNLGAGDQTTDEAARMKAEADAKKKVSEDLEADIRMVQRAHKDHPLEAKVAEISTRNPRRKKT